MTYFFPKSFISMVNIYIPLRGVAFELSFVLSLLLALFFVGYMDHLRSLISQTFYTRYSFGSLGSFGFLLLQDTAPWSGDLGLSTGFHSILAASSFRGVNLRALACGQVDLSLSSA
jgi:hypothetical protein